MTVEFQPGITIMTRRARLLWEAVDAIQKRLPVGECIARLMALREVSGPGAQETVDARLAELREIEANGGW